MNKGFLFVSATCGISAALSLFGCSSDDDKTPSGPSPEAGTDTGGASSGGKTSSGGASSGGKTSSGGASSGGKTSVTPDGGSADGGDGGVLALSISATVCSSKGLDAVACGEYIVRHVGACGDCHTPRGAAPADYLTGNPTFADIVPGDDTKGLIGTPNLTVLKSEGWTAAEVKDAILNGKRSAARGGGLFPIMPYYVFHNMATDDADAIAAFILSLTATGTQVPARQPLPIPDAAFPIGPQDAKAIPLPAAGPNFERAIRGMYTATTIGACIECHTAHVPSGLDQTKLFAGGETYVIGGPFGTVYSANLTRAESGIKGWTPEDVQKLILTGVTKTGTGLCPPMPAGPNGAYGGMYAEQALDIGYYITGLAGIENPEDGGRLPTCVPPGPPPVTDSGTPDAN